jgi:CRP/FNR family cyclic AMP-dependent transcriptional regulator
MGSVSGLIPSGGLYRCGLLREDHELAEAIPARRRAEAVEECTARALRVPAGRWRYDAAHVPRAEVGLLVLQGLIVARHCVGGRESAELLGEGDLLNLHREGDQASLLTVDARWSVLEPARLALLDQPFVQQHVARHPELVAALLARSARRSRSLAVSLAIAHQPSIDVRIRMLLWHLAGRWGRVRPDGVLVPMRLTHSVLADLVAAQRPTVSTALSGLADRGLVCQTGDGWLLRGGCIGHEMLPAVLHTENDFRSDYAGVDRR